MKEIRVKVTFIEDLLGTATNNKEVYRESTLPQKDPIQHQSRMKLLL